MRNLSKQMSAAVAAIDALSRTALDALPLRLEVLDLRELQRQQRLLGAAAKAAEVTPTAAARKNVLPVEIAHEVALHYIQLTGEKQTRRSDAIDGKAYGPFLDLLDDVYAALGIKASADYVIRNGCFELMDF